MKRKLTEQQHKAYLFIEEYLSERGFPPTLREIAEYMGYAAVGSVQSLIKSLQEKGYLQKQVEKGYRTLMPTAHVERSKEEACFFIPRLGQVPAGNPIEAIESHAGEIAVPVALLPRPRPKQKELFALQAHGVSMIGAGIFGGDWLVVRQQPEANPKDIVIARLEDGKATVKRLMKDRRSWYLQPENPDFKPTYAKDSPFEVIGRVLAVMRTL